MMFEENTWKDQGPPAVLGGKRNFMENHMNQRDGPPLMMGKIQGLFWYQHMGASWHIIHHGRLPDSPRLLRH